jgi:peptidoglycan/LPS O-acetylase OafA/YrhL
MREPAASPSTPADPVGHAQAPPSRPVSLPSLTGLRFLAALAVFVCHTAATSNLIPPFTPVVPFTNQHLDAVYNQVAFNGGFVGVSFFYVLSGFVLTWSTKEGERARSFWRRRVLKIYPNHFVTFVVCMVLFGWAITPAAQWVPNLLLVQAWSPDAATRGAVNSPSWSLCCELLFYVLFPFLIKPLRRIAENRLWFWAGGLFLVMLAIALFNKFAVPSLLPDPTVTGPLPSTGPGSATGPQYWIGYFLPVSRLFEFLLGVVAARIVLAGKWPRAIRVLPAAVLLAAAYALSVFLSAPFTFDVTTVIPIVLLIGAVAASDVGGRSRVFNTRGWIWLGEISFAFYLCQGITLLWARYAMGGAQYGVVPGILLLLALFVATLITAALLHRYVEAPIMRKWSRSSRSRSVPGNPAVPAASMGSAD